MQKAMCPEWMTPSEQMQEVARILAGGILRIQHQQAAQRTHGEKVLDFHSDKSVNGAKPAQGGDN